MVYENAERVLNLRAETRAALNELRALERGKLTLGANETTALYLLPVLQRFRQRYPPVQVSVKRCLSREIPGTLVRHEIDLGVLSYNPRNPDLESTVVSLDELCMIVPPQHPLANAREVSVRDLGGESFIAHSTASPYRQSVIETFARLRTPLRIAAELPTVETIKKFVGMGMGVAFAPRMCVQDELARQEFVAVNVKELRIQRKLRLVYRRRGALSAAAQQFLRVAKEISQV
jgi:DNA-binding transcriptional LysR family regulator